MIFPIGYITVLIAVLAQSVNAKFSKPITQVQPLCADSTDGITFVTLTSDAPVFFGYAKCHGDQQFNFTEVNMANHRLEVYYSGDHSQRCLFDKKQRSRTYTLEVFVVVGTDNGVLMDEQFYLITCTYDPHTAEESGVKDFSKGLNPAKDVTVNQGGQAQSRIDLAAVDIFHAPIVQSLTMGTMIKLRATMSESAAGEHSFHPLTCTASAPGGSEYNILVAGCGDGRVLDETEGFDTQGKVAYSPVFKTFRLKGARSLTFTCTYYICSESCNGTSCLSKEGQRKRRQVDQHLEDFQTTEFYEKSEDEDLAMPDVLDRAENPDTENLDTEEPKVKRVYYSTVHYYINDPDVDALTLDPENENTLRMSAASSELRMSEKLNSASTEDDSDSGLIVGISLLGVLSLVTVASLVLLLYKTKSMMMQQEGSVVGSGISIRSYSSTSIENDNYLRGNVDPRT